MSQAGPALPPVFLAGPTATGKSAIALLLAERIGGEIISVDSMQVYRGLDIGTAKPGPADRARVPHHLVDILAVTDPFDVADFVQRARNAVADLERRGRRPVFCGGTGLYFRAYVEGLGDAPASDPALRAALGQEPLPALLEELARRDRVTWETIDRANPRRVVRALEVIRLTGRPYSEQRAPWTPAAAEGGPGVGRMFCLDRAGPDLTARIEARVDAMFAAGLVEETGRQLELGLGRNPTALQAIGYRQVIEHLRGERDLAATVALVKARTRQYAKRQRTWFRRQCRAEWIELGANTPATAVADDLQQRLG